MKRREFLKMVTLSSAALLSRSWSDTTLARQTLKAPFTVHMTFDDGPTTRYDLTGPTTDVLDTLAEANAHATFFLHGRAINNWEGPILARIINDGHAIGNHLWQQGGNTVGDAAATIYHMAYHFLEAEERIRQTLAKADSAAYERYLAQPKLFRRPGGGPELSNFLRERYFRALRNSKYMGKYRDKVDWLTGVYDYSGWHCLIGDTIPNRSIRPMTVAAGLKMLFEGGYGYHGVDQYLCAGKPAQRSLEAEQGLIVLMHDAVKMTRQALPTVIAQLKDRGAVFAPLPRTVDQPNTTTVKIDIPPTPDPSGLMCGE